MSNSKECTLTDSELTEKVEKWVTDLCNSRGEKWCLCIPADHNHDPDFIFVEAVRRMNKYASRISELEAENKRLREAIQYYFDVLKEVNGKDFLKRPDHVIEKMLDAMNPQPPKEQ
jgi:hypothetical protein